MPLPVTYHDDYHKVTREKMADYYKNGGGREKKSISSYLKRYQLDRSFIADCETVTDQLDKLKKHALFVKKLKT